MSEVSLAMEMNKLNSRIEELLSRIDELDKKVTSIELNEQRYLKKNNPISPAMGIKVAYDENGLIKTSMGLLSSDLPEITIPSITGLQEVLNNKADINDIPNIDHIKIRSNKIYATGTKINYDENGYIISSSELSTDDIPILPISKIEGLSDAIELAMSISSSYNAKPLVEDLPQESFPAGIYTKVNIDSMGRIIAASNITIEDIPDELVSKVNVIESMIPNLASQTSIDGLSASLNNKLDKNLPVEPGTYTKVTIDKQGLVLLGKNLTKEDLPDIGIDDIDGLRLELNNKSTIEQFHDLNESMQILMRSINDIGDLIKLKNELPKLVSDEKFRLLQDEVSLLHSTFDELNEKIPNDTILEQLKVITTNLSNFNQRLSVMENKMGVTV